MQLTPQKINFFTMANLPSAWLCGVRVKSLSSECCVVSVKHNWMTKNPFKSMYFAVQAMAAELATGALVMAYIKEAKQPISMLVANNKSSFSKKATGRIEFVCNNGKDIANAIQQAIDTGEGQTVWMKSIGTNQDAVVVSTFEFEWTVKVK